MNRIRTASIRSALRLFALSAIGLSSCGADSGDDSEANLPSAFTGQSPTNPAQNVESNNTPLGEGVTGANSSDGQQVAGGSNGSSTAGVNENPTNGNVDLNGGQNADQGAGNSGDGSNQNAGANAQDSGNAGAGGASMGTGGEPVDPGQQDNGGQAGAGMLGAAGAAMTGGNSEPVDPGSNCGGAAFFCEDFEGLPTGPLQAGTNGMTPERTVNIVNEPGRGLVLQAQAGRGYNSKAGFFLNDFSAPNNSFYGRMYVNVDVFAKTDNDHWVIVEATGDGAPTSVRPVGGQFEKWAPGSDGDASGDWTDHDVSQAFTQDGAWTCVEWQLDGSNGGNDMVLWADGVEIQPREHGGFTLPTFNRLWFGWVVYQDGRQPTAFDVRFDDIVLSTERVGCN